MSQINSHKLILIKTTTATQQNATEIAKKLLDQKLVACVSVTPITSYYIWKTELQSSQEFALEIKSIKHYYKQIEACILACHEYDLPQILQLDILDVNKKYKDWVEQQLLS